MSSVHHLSSLGSSGRLFAPSIGYAAQSSAFVAAPTESLEPKSRADSDPLSIAHLGPCLFRGGAEQQLIDLAKFLDPARAVLRRCLVTNPKDIDPLVASDLGCEVIPATKASVAETLRDFDVLLYWGMELPGWIDPAADRKAAIVYLAHGDSYWTRDLLKNSREFTDHSVAVSRRVLETTCADCPATVILNGVDTARLATTRCRNDVRAEFGYGEADFVVGYVGRFSPEKRPELLIQALALLPRRFKGLFVGWGPLEASLLAEANRTIPNRFAFRYADRYLGDYYQSFDAFSLSSVQEGFALVFLEAMFAGKAVVATPVGAVPEVIEDRVNGLIVEGTAISIAAALEQLERNPAWARGIAESAERYARVNGHALRMAREYETLLRRLVDERRSGR